MSVWLLTRVEQIVTAASKCNDFLARDAFIRTNRCTIAMMFVRLSACLSVRQLVSLSGTGVHCDHTVHFSADLSLRFDSPICSGHPDTKACPATFCRISPVLPGTEVEYGCAN